MKEVGKQANTIQSDKLTIDVIRRESTVFGTVVSEREGDEDKIAEQNRRDGVVSRNNLLSSVLRSKNTCIANENDNDEGCD